MQSWTCSYATLNSIQNSVTVQHELSKFVPHASLVLIFSNILAGNISEYHSLSTDMSILEYWCLLQNEMNPPTLSWLLHSKVLSCSITQVGSHKLSFTKNNWTFFFVTLETPILIYYLYHWFENQFLRWKLTIYKALPNLCMNWTFLYTKNTTFDVLLVPVDQKQFVQFILTFLTALHNLHFGIELVLVLKSQLLELNFTLFHRQWNQRWLIQSFALIDYKH